MAKLQKLNEKDNEQKPQLENMIEQTVKEDKRLILLVEAGLNGVIPGIVSALTFLADQWLHGSQGLNLKQHLVLESGADKIISLRYGAFQMGIVDTEHSENIKETIRQVLRDLESRVKEWEIYQDLGKTRSDITKLSSKLREELAIIRLKRIVPGRCKFCPL